MNKRNEHHRDTFFQRLQYHILRNIEIELTNIHITFDDKTTKHYPFQFGLTIQSFLLKVFKSLSLRINKYFFSRKQMNNGKIKIQKKIQN